MALSPTPRPDTAPAPTGGAMAQLRGLTEGVTRFTAQPAIRRALPSLVLIGAVAFALLAWVILREPPRSTLFPGMAEADKARVMESLTAAGIPARVDGTSGEITVPSAEYHRARLSLAANGLPQSVPDGDQALSSLPMGASRALENARLRQAHELELARSISEIGMIQSARVHLALPEKSAFLRDSHPPRASVILGLASGRVLDQGQVEAIVHLVSSSVPGMARSDVSVVDQAGRLISSPDTDSTAQFSDRQLRHRAEVEDRLRRRVESLLVPLVGHGNLSVEVTAALDFTQREITEERVDPEGNALRSEQLTEAETRDAPAGGIPGAVSNTPPAEVDLAQGAPIAANGQPGTIRNRTSGTTRNYEVSRTVQNIRPETGQITRLSAAVVIRAPVPVAPENPGQPTEPPIPAATLEEFRKLVETAIGFDAERGDSVTLVAQPFAIPELPAVAEPGYNFDWLGGALREAVLIGILALVGFGFVRPLLMRQTAQAGTLLPQGATTVEVAEGESLGDLEAKLDRRHMDLAGSVLGNNASRAEKQAVLRRLVTDDPVRIAMVMHRMMKPELDTVR